MTLQELTREYRRALMALLDGEDSGDETAAPSARCGMLAVTRELRRLGLSFIEAKAVTHTLMIQHHNENIGNGEERWRDE